MKVINVFTSEAGQFGNPVGVIVDIGNKISKLKRQQIAKNSGFSEVVFVNDLATKNISIYSPQREIPFAGHAVVGTAYYLNQLLKTPINELMGIGGLIRTWREADLTWVKVGLSITPSWNYEQLSSPSMVEQLSKQETSSKEHTVVWAWLDQSQGIIRARTFAPDWGIPEDEANGSGAMKLAFSLGKELTIHHGKGSLIHARPFGSASAAVGGLVAILNS